MARKRTAPLSSQDFHDYFIDLEIPENYLPADHEDICVRQKGSRVTVDLDCRAGRVEKLTEEQIKEVTPLEIDMTTPKAVLDYFSEERKALKRKRVRGPVQKKMKEYTKTK